MINDKIKARIDKVGGPLPVSKGIITTKYNRFQSILYTKKCVYLGSFITREEAAEVLEEAWQYWQSLS